MGTRLFLLLCLCLSSLFALPSQPTININNPNFFVGKSMLVYEDKGANLTLEQITKLPKDTFVPLEHDIFSYPFTSSTFWYCLEVKNPQAISQARLMVFEAPWLDYIQVNIISPKQHRDRYELGNTFNYSKRSIDHPFINQEHEFEPGISRIYIQVKTRDPFVFTLSILDEKTFLLEQIEQSKYIGLLYGVLLAMILYNLFLFFGIKEPYYAYYVLFVTAFLISNASYNGYTFQHIFADAPHVQNWMQSSSIFFFSLTNILFAKSFLNLRQMHPNVNLSSNVIALSLIAISILSALAGGYHYHVIFAIAFSAIIGSYIFAIAVFSLYKGNRSALFFLLGSISGLLGTVITALTVMGQFPYYDFTYKALDIGMIIDAVLLSLALAHRMKITQEEKLIAEKDSRTDVLTSLMNRRAYYEISTQETSRHQRYKTDLSLIILDIDNFKDFNDTYGHDVGDNVLRYIGTVLEDLKRENDYAFRLGGDEFVILLPEANKEQATHLTQRINEDLQQKPFRIDDIDTPLTVSTGIAQFKATDTSITFVEKRADIALYEAKNRQRGI